MSNNHQVHKIYTVKPKFYDPAFCIFLNFMYFCKVQPKCPYVPQLYDFLECTFLFSSPNYST